MVQTRHLYYSSRAVSAVLLPSSARSLFSSAPSRRAYEAYRQAIQNELSWARIVVEHFHLVRGANTALDSVRRNRQRERATRRPKGIREQAHRDRWSPSPYRARHLLLKASEGLSERDRRRLCALFERDPLLAGAWGLKETFRYEHFGGVGDALLAACDAELELLLDRVGHAVVAERRWSDGVRGGPRRPLEWTGEEPQLARCCFVELYRSAGRRAVPTAGA